MSTINNLLKKRAELEAKIAEAQRLQKRKGEIVALLEKHRLLDLTEAFQRERDKGANLYIVGDGHPNQAAHELISREIARYVRDNDLL